MRTIYIIALVLLCLPLTAQRMDINTIDSFDLSSYRARYARRPLMEFNPNLRFYRTTSSSSDATNHFTGSLTYNWRLRRLQESFIEVWELSTSPYVRWVDDNSDFWRLPLSANYSRQQFYRPRRFYGYQAGLDLSYEQTIGAASQQSALSPPVNLSVFVGGGRIEYAEDALLAAWTLKDLEVAGVLPRAVTSRDVHQLARTITELIGNRVFDLRRRRIYELEQLHTRVQALYPELPMSIELFTIINDNWAFANRVELPHGNEWRAGPQASNLSHFNFEDGQRLSTRTTQLWGGFVQWRRARIHHNRTASDLSLLLQGTKNDQRIRFLNSEFVITDDFRSQLQARYGYSWFPFSRTLLRATTHLSYNYWWDTDNQWAKSAEYWEGDFSVSADIFLNYRWNLTLSLGLGGSYFPAQNELSLSPLLTVRSLYNIF